MKFLSNYYIETFSPVLVDMVVVVVEHSNTPHNSMAVAQVDKPMEAKAVVIRVDMDKIQVVTTRVIMQHRTKPEPVGVVMIIRLGVYCSTRCWIWRCARRWLQYCRGYNSTTGGYEDRNTAASGGGGYATAGGYGEY